MIFTIDNDNDIRAYETEAQAEEATKAAGTILIRSANELAKAAGAWPARRLVELWNSFAGVAPFTDCKPVKKFENRGRAVARIWATIQRLGNAVSAKPPEQATACHESAERPQPLSWTNSADRWHPITRRTRPKPLEWCLDSSSMNGR